MPDEPVTIDSITAQFDTLTGAIEKSHTDANNFIAALKAQIANGTAVTQAQLDLLSTKISSTTQMVNDFDLTTTEAPQEPEPLPLPLAA